jgi:pyridoxal phosphate enzyme (YggS family)
LSDLQERYREVCERISEAVSAAGRSSSEVELVVISKNHPAELVRELFSLGHRNFGENRDQEARPKAEATTELEGIRWHFVGQLQSNKVKSALTYSNFLHSIDRDSLLNALRRELSESQRTLGGFIQLNLTDDPGRGGIAPADVRHFAEAALGLPNFDLLGVMGVAALDRDPRIDFETIAQASRALLEVAPAAKFISAGMSHDFREAIEFGATHLRIGTAITGNRNL